MIMAVKYQIWMSPNPRHLIMITLNHLDALTDYATCPATKKNIFTTYELLIQVRFQLFLILDDARGLQIYLLDLLRTFY